MKKILYFVVLASFFWVTENVCVTTTTTTAQPLLLATWVSNVQNQLTALTNYVNPAVNGALPTATVATLPVATVERCLAKITDTAIKANLMQGLLNFYSHYSPLFLARSPRVISAAFRVQRDLLIYTLIRVSGNGNPIINTFDVENAIFTPVNPYIGTFTEADIVQNLWDIRS